MGDLESVTLDGGRLILRYTRGFAGEAPSSVTYRVETVLGAGKPVVKALSAALSRRPAD